MHERQDGPKIGLSVGHDAEKRLFWLFKPRGDGFTFWKLVEALPKTSDVERREDSVVARGGAAVVLADLVRAYGLRIVDEVEQL